MSELDLTWRPPQPTPQGDFCLPQDPVARQPTAVFERLLTDVNRRTEARTRLAEFKVHQSEPLPVHKSTRPVTVYQRLVRDAQSRQVLTRASEPTTPKESRLPRAKTAALVTRLHHDATRRVEEKQRTQKLREEKALEEALRLANLHHSRPKDSLIQSRIEATWQQVTSEQTNPPPQQTPSVAVLPKSKTLKDTSESPSVPVFTRYASKLSQRQGQTSVQRMLAEAERVVLSLSPQNSRGSADIDELLQKLQAPPQPQPSQPRHSAPPKKNSITQPPKIAPRLALQQARTQFGQLLTSFDQ